MGKKVYTNAYAWKIFGIHKKIDICVVRCIHYLSSLDFWKMTPIFSRVPADSFSGFLMFFYHLLVFSQFLAHIL